MDVLIVFGIFFFSWFGFIFLGYKKKWDWVASIGGGFLIACLSFIITTNIIVPSEPVTKETERKASLGKNFSDWDGSHVNLERHIKKSMNDPKSYEHIETKYWDHDEYLIVQTTFRGKNAFGALVKNQVKAKVGLNGEVIEILDSN
jgi:hypothetical protein